MKNLLLIITAYCQIAKDFVCDPVSTSKQLIKSNRQLAVYILVGTVNTTFGYGLFSLLIFIGLYYPVAVFLSTCLAVLFSFKTMGIIVFKNPENRLIFRFIAVNIIRFFLNLGLIKLQLIVGINIYIAGAIALIILTFFAYVWNKFFVFAKK